MDQSRILELCARPEGHDQQYERLREACSHVSDWDALVKMAAREGMTPLLCKHLIDSKSEMPRRIRQLLVISVKQLEHRARVRDTILESVLALCRANDLTPLILKGAALCHTIYSTPSLRPMRDIDILLRQEEARILQDLLLEEGFNSSTSPIPADHHHLPSLEKTVESVSHSIEIHTGLYPDCPPYYPDIDFERLLADAELFSLNSFSFLTLGKEDTLHYLYQHGVRGPLTYESNKLIHIADLIGCVETYADQLDWDKLKHVYPALYSGLPLLNLVTPYKREKIPRYFILLFEKTKNLKVKQFSGWPKERIKLQRIKRKSLFKVVTDTFFPPRWWIMLYYGLSHQRKYYSCVLFTHPRHIFWWMRLYGSYLETKQEVTGPLSLALKVRALFKKLRKD